jgi:hypothetical protein
MDENSPYRKLFLYSIGIFSSNDKIDTENYQFPSFDVIVPYCIKDIFLGNFVKYLYEKNILIPTSEHFEIAAKHEMQNMIFYYIKKEVKFNAKILYYLKLIELEKSKPCNFTINLFNFNNITLFPEMIILFTSSGHIDILKQFSNKGIYLSNDVLYEAAKNGNSEIMEYYFNYIQNIDVDFLNILLRRSFIILIRNKKYDTFNYFYYQTDYISDDIMKMMILEIIKTNDYECIKYFYENYVEKFTKIVKSIRTFYTYMIKAIEYAKIEYIYFLFDIYIDIKKKFSDLHKYKILQAIISNGNIEVLDRFIIQYSIDLKKFRCLTSLCVKNDNFEMLCYLTDKNANKDEDVITLAIEKCRLDIIKFAVDHDYPRQLLLRDNISKKLEIYMYLNNL